MKKEDQQNVYQRSRVITLGKALADHLECGKGIILGSCAVVSRNFHFEPRDSEGTVIIYTDRDAGKIFFNMVENDQVIHIDVYHQPAEINVFDLANRILVSTAEYLDLVEGKEERLSIEREALTLNLAQRVHLRTATGEGTVLKPFKAPGLPGGAVMSHVHILARLPQKYLGLIYSIVDQTEKAILYQDTKLRQISNIVHHSTTRTNPENFPLGVPVTFNKTGTPPEVMFQNYFQALYSAAVQVGSLEILAKFLSSISPAKFLNMRVMMKTHPSLGILLKDMEKLNLVIGKPMGYSLTACGYELNHFLHRHQKELAAQIRKAIRQIPAKAGATPLGHPARCPVKENINYNYKKSVNRNETNSSNPIAVPETVINAAKRSYLENSSALCICNRDIMVCPKRSRAPVDICIVADCSGSMKGDKISAVRWVAEHLLLTTRDKVALVSFQERDAAVNIEFTRNYSYMHSSLNNLAPHGLTPLAKGLETGLTLIRQSRPKNPLLVLITDGRPNTPLVSLDPVADAVNICRSFPKHRIRFTAVGIDPLGEFIPTLAEAAKGTYYLVEDIDRSSLINIMHGERKVISKTKS
ncbi:vWA domain-containing protein [Phosphitispora fastidiosa]|uniref:vWA domain-containing protein n=1 Tax=Phosphitispora fastidiosa TaxID=2837202 RepID=UPI001E377822|nr:VWA domain-containing protein [Phosphitispora fastidiosa]MBU7005295.1 magnesium chelatase subunit D [Phosphitispora fastidiosa]